MKATILLGTLKRSGLSNTQTLCDFLAERMEARGIACEVIRLVDHRILPGTHSDMGAGDEWPQILERLFASDMVLMATPIWWDNHSSLIQRAIERLDEMHDRVMEGEPSPLDGKVGGVVITGDSDGAQHIIGMICNFFNAIGIMVPPYCSLSVLWEGMAKGADTTREEILEKLEEDYAQTADTMIERLLAHAGSNRNEE
jgi:multimeric flavodoxin WrbA